MVTIEETMKLLEERKGSWPRVAKESGVGYEWLIKFSRGEIPKPGFEPVTKLYTYLKSKQAA